MLTKPNATGLSLMGYLASTVIVTLIIKRSSSSTSKLVENDNEHCTSASTPDLNANKLSSSKAENIIENSVSGNVSNLTKESISLAAEPSFTDSASGKPFSEFYELGPDIGKGAFSSIREASYKPTKLNKNSYAIKIVRKDNTSLVDLGEIGNEVGILKEMRHPHVLKIYDYFEDDACCYLVTEKMEGGELYDRIVQKDYYNEKEGRDVCKILLEAVSYIHEKHVVHRDLKPENLLLASNDDDSFIKIADFGFAKKCDNNSFLSTQCGTPSYVAPEILYDNARYGTKVDMWSLGVILYTVLGGYPPFNENSISDLLRVVKAGDYEFHPIYWANISEDATTLISSFLTVDPRKRLSAKQGLQSQWMNQDGSCLLLNDLGDNLYKFKNFNGKRKLRAAVRATIVTNRMERLNSSF